jgi:hypothetical protein
MLESKRNELNAPPISNEASAFEVLRVWAGSNQPQQVSLRTTWPDPAAWGLMLVDIARHASKAYADGDAIRGQEVLARIKQAFDAEWQAPTDEAEQIK